MKQRKPASDIILTILGFVIVLVLCRLGIFCSFVAGAAFAIIMNRRIIGKVAERIKRRF